MANFFAGFLNTGFFYTDKGCCFKVILLSYAGRYLLALFPESTLKVIFH